MGDDAKAKLEVGVAVWNPNLSGHSAQEYVMFSACLWWCVLLLKFGDAESRRPGKR